LARQVGREIGTSDGVIVFDPSGFAKKGDSSVGVQRQWLARLGKVDNGQVGVFMAYASRHDHALVNIRLCLSKAWAKDRARRKHCTRSDAACPGGTRLNPNPAERTENDEYRHLDKRPNRRTSTSSARSSPS
jgi:SRSO17 transposase